MIIISEQNKLTIAYGNSPENMTRKILDAMEPFTGLSPNALITLKPNLVLSKPCSSGATTTPGIAREIIRYLQERGFRNIMIMESSWLGANTKKAFRVCGYEDISKECGVPLLDLKKDRTRKVKCGDLTLKVYQTILDTDYLINIPVLKAHCQTRLTCALKNLKGCIPDREKKRYHSLGLHQPIALLNTVIKSDLIIVDGLMGDLTHEEGGNPVEMGRIIGGRDPVLTDSYAAGLIGYRVAHIPYIGLAAEMGVGMLYGEETVIQEIDRNTVVYKSFQASALAEKLGRLIVAREACSPCYGGIIHALQRLKEQGLLSKIPGKIHVGRGFREEDGPKTPNNNGKRPGNEETGRSNKKNAEGGNNQLGIGNCTSCLHTNLPGCPPRAADIIDFLKKSGS